MTHTPVSTELGTYRRAFARSPVLRTALGELLRVREHDDVEERDALAVALAWVARAQDACPDGAVSRGYRLLRGWCTGDLETTAAAVPLFATAAVECDDPSLRARARRAASSIPSLLDAAGLSAAETLAAALAGAAAWATGAPPALRAESVARVGHLAALLVDALDRRDEAVHQPASGAARWTRAASAAAALCAAADCTGDLSLAARAASMLDAAAATADLHDVAATLARRPAGTGPIASGVAALPLMLRDLRSAAIALDRRELLALVEREGEALLRRFELRRRIAIGVPSAARARRVTGYSPVAWSGAALYWLEEFMRSGDPRPLNAALSALDVLGGAQRLRPGVDDVHGAIRAPVAVLPRLGTPVFDGLAAVLHARARVAARRALRDFDRFAARWRPAPFAVPRALPSVPDDAGSDRPPRVVLYASPTMHRAPRMLERWREFGFVPSAVVMERRPPLPLARRIRDRIAADGLGEALRRVARRAVPRPVPSTAESTVDYCARRGIRVVDVGALDDPESVRTVAELAPDLAIHVGTGILRAPLLAVPRLGTLNIHNGILPRFRGVNVAEWARLLREPVGCTVHLVDPGIDTGDILLAREVDVREARAIDELRALVDRAQASILGDVVRWILRSGELPPRRDQRPEDGRQFFTMHETLRRLLSRRLEASRDRAEPGEIAVPALRTRSR